VKLASCWLGGLGVTRVSMLIRRSWVGMIAAACAIGVCGASAAAEPEHPSLPHVSAPLVQTSTSHAFAGAAYQERPLDLHKLGYVETEYTVSGVARVFDWPAQPGGPPQVLAGPGPYTTRILVREPENPGRFNGTAIVELFNPSESVDLPIMWAESYLDFIAKGYAWVGITIKPNDIKSLQAFDAARYGSLKMPNPRSVQACPGGEINAFSQPTTTADETGLAWDMVSQVGALLKSRAASNPLVRPAERLYMTGQSQTAGYARLYASLFNRGEAAADGKPLYDGFLYSGSPPWQVPIHQCRKDFAPGDPRLITAGAGVPVIEIFTQGDMKTNVETRRADGDTAGDLFRRYEVAGAAHVDDWESLSFAGKADMVRAHRPVEGGADEGCQPSGVTLSNFPVRYVFDAAWSNLDDWVRQGVPAPHAKPLALKAGPTVLPPDQAFLVDGEGNALGGVRTPYVDVPTARWIGARLGPFVCLFRGYKYDLAPAELQRLYGTHEAYVRKVAADSRELQAARWLTPSDAAAIVREAEQAKVP
jgi:alpha/beta hydrolase family protein